jgi:hypothetical protein
MPALPFNQHTHLVPRSSPAKPAATRNALVELHNAMLTAQISYDMPIVSALAPRSSPAKPAATRNAIVEPFNALLMMALISNLTYDKCIVSTLTYTLWFLQSYMYNYMPWGRGFGPWTVTMWHVARNQHLSLRKAMGIAVITCEI